MRKIELYMKNIFRSVKMTLKSDNKKKKDGNHIIKILIINLHKK